MNATPGSDPGVPAALDAISRHRGWFIAIGIVWLVLGTLAVSFPARAGLALNLVLGVLLVIAGGAGLIHANRARDWRGFWLALIGGLLDLVVGALLLTRPVTGVAVLTLLLAAWFIASGTMRALLGLRHRPERGWLWLLAGGLLSLVLGVLIWSGWPGTSAFAIGLLVGIHLIFSGWSMIMVAWGAGHGAQDPAR